MSSFKDIKHYDNEIYIIVPIKQDNKIVEFSIRKFKDNDLKLVDKKTENELIFDYKMKYNCWQIV